MVKPGGTGTPRLVISASSHPLPPRRWRSALDPSALPLAKEYTYLGRRAAGFADLLRTLLPGVARGIQQSSRRRPSRSGRTTCRETKAGPEEACVIQECYSEGRRSVNEYCCATGTYGSSARTLPPGPRLARAARDRAPIQTARDEPLHCRQMIEHGPASSGLVAPADGLE